jgi:hypothetical protein
MVCDDELLRHSLPAHGGDALSMYAKRSFPTVLKDIALFLAAPFIALAYLTLFPFFGIGLLLKARKTKRA